MIPKRPISRRYKLISGYAIMFFMNGCFYTWSMLSLMFMQAFPNWTAAQMALTGTCNLVVSAVAPMLVPKILRKISTRAAVRLGGLLLGVGWFCMALLRWCPNILLLYVGYAIAGYGNGHIYSVIGQVLNSSFPDYSGTVSGGLLFVTGFGALFVGAVEQALVVRMGISSMCLLFSGVLFLLIFLCAHWQILPEPKMQSKSGPGDFSEQDVPDLTFRQVLRQPTFLLFFAWAVLLASGGLLAINNAANIFDYYQAPAVAGMIVMLFTGIGCQLMGFAMDRFGLRKSMTAASVFSFAVGVLLLAGHFSGQTAAILIGVLLCGIGYGTTTSAKMAGAVKLYGSKNLTTVFGLMNLNVVPAAFMGPYISGWFQLLDLGYLPSFILIAILAVLSLMVTCLNWKRLK